MGAIKSSKLDNGMVGLEITYGGKDAPFSGCDFSAPPMYIDPTSFTDASGFLVMDGQLVACGWFPLSITLQGWTASMTYMDSGTMFTNGQYYNWALASSTTTSPGSGDTPASSTTTFTIWTWLGLYPGSVPITTTLTVTQHAVSSPASPATATIMISGPTATTTGTNSVQFNNNIGSIYPTTISAGDTPSMVATNMANYLNTTAANLIVSAAAVGNTVTLTTKATGSIANTTGLAVWSDAATVPGVIPIPTILQGFSGGLDSVTPSYGIPPSPVTWVCVGETLYIGGYGTMILQFNMEGSTPVLSVCTQYIGAICLGKFNSQLIAAGIVPGPGSVKQGVIQQPEMVLAWSSPNELTVWNPINPDGTVTGAGFNQISDISDYLSGLFLTPGTCVILRAQGIDYITPLSGGISPFDFAHISNAFKGEGCQHLKLVTEYDQVGTFIGNTNVFQFSGGIAPIGDKIKNQIFTRPAPGTYRNRDSASGPYNEFRALQVFSIFVMDDTIFNYNYENKTWMPYYFASSGANVFDVEWLTRDLIPPDRPQEYCNSCPILITDDTTSDATPPAYWRLQSYVQDTVFPHGTQCYVTFPEEEVSFGRDITIESAYVSIAGSPSTEIHFWISNKLHAFLTLPTTADPTIYANYQIWFVADPTLDDKTTIQNPQLSISVPFVPPNYDIVLRFSKIALFGSFDPNQRPV